MKFVFSKLTKLYRVQRGFTLIEMLVTISIILMVTSAVLLKQTSFTSITLLKSQALELSLDIRSAQQYGVSALADRPDSTVAYGVYFDAQEPGQYQLFLDANQNSLYDPGEELGVANILDDRFFLKEICIQGDCSSTRAASVAFQRPNFDAVIGNTNHSGADYRLHGRTKVDIVLAPKVDTNMTRAVTVYQTGQISMQ